MSQEEPFAPLSDPARVDARLRQLHPTLNSALLIEAAVYGLAQKNNCTLNHGRIYPSLVMHFESLSRLRELLIPYGWMPESENNFETIISPDGGFQISVSGGDEAVGDSDRTPTNRSKKGLVTQRIVRQNRQARLPFEENREQIDQHNVRVFSHEMPAEVSVVTWMLVHSFIGNELRCELSRPDSMEEGQITQWSERLILTSVFFDDIPAIRPEDEPVNPIVDVRRRG